MTSRHAAPPHGEGPTASAPLRPLPLDHERLCAAVREAGAVVLERYRGHPVRQWLKDDRSPVTEADMEANRILKAALLDGPTAHYGWLSEECPDDQHRLSAPRTFIVDPIDGTRAFMEGRPDFTVCGAITEGEQVVAAAIFSPVTDEFFDATLGGGARCNGDAIHATDRQALSGARILGRKRTYTHPGWPTPWPPLALSYRCSTAYSMALVAKGAYDATLALLRKPDWDVCAGTLIAQEAGAIVSDHKGGGFAFNLPEPIQRGLVCTAPSLYRAILPRLGHLPGDLREIRL